MDQGAIMYDDMYYHTYHLDLVTSQLRKYLNITETCFVWKCIYSVPLRSLTHFIYLPDFFSPLNPHTPHTRLDGMCMTWRESHQPCIKLNSCLFALLAFPSLMAIMAWLINRNPIRPLVPNGPWPWPCPPPLDIHAPISHCAKKRKWYSRHETQLPLQCLTPPRLRPQVMIQEFRWEREANLLTNVLINCKNGIQWLLLLTQYSVQTLRDWDYSVTVIYLCITITILLFNHHPIF